MTPEEIILMAREAGIKFAPAQFSGVLEAEVSEYDLARFAALVAAAEREACAQVCDEKAAKIRLYCNPTHVVECAAAIRKRGAP